jgi:metal-responsive CopG/Arc/MetJ family transcriptional regulator
LTFRAPPDLIAALDAWIAEQPDRKPSRSDAIRRMLTEALTK